MKKLKYAAFKGRSIFSDAINFYTRGEYSHIAINDWANDRLIEQWPHDGGFIRSWMDYSSFDKHEPGTEYEIWTLEVPNFVYDYCMTYYYDEADKKTAYDWKGIWNFVFKGDDDKHKTFCSEAAVIPLCKSLNWNKIDPASVHPSFFVYLLQAAGGYPEHSGIT